MTFVSKWLELVIFIDDREWPFRIFWWKIVEISWWLSHVETDAEIPRLTQLIIVFKLPCLVPSLGISYSLWPSTLKSIVACKGLSKKGLSSYDNFPEIKILWFWFPGLFIFLGNSTISLQREKTFKLRIVFAIYQIDALKRYLYNNNLISTQSPFQKLSIFFIKFRNQTLILNCTDLWSYLNLLKWRVSSYHGHEKYNCHATKWK